MSNKIRPIVKAAFKVDELVEQFENIDVPDGVLETGSIDEVNEKFSDSYLIGEAKNRLSMIDDQIDNISHYDSEDRKLLMKDKRQLASFIKKWG